MMRYFLSVVLVITLSFFFVNSVVYATELRENERLFESHLLPCSQASSCVVSLDEESSSYIAPIPYHSEMNRAKNTLLKVLTVVPRTQVRETTDNYLKAESRGKIFGGVDELEFYFPPNQQVIHLRSASRNRKFDLGINRRRLEQIRLALRELNI